MTTLVLGIFACAFLLFVLLYAIRPLARAAAEEEEASEQLIDVYQNPQQSSPEAYALARTLGYTTVLEAYGPIAPGRAHQILYEDGAALRSFHWQPGGALLTLDAHKRPAREGLYLQVWDDNGVFHRPIGQNTDGLRRLVRLWRNAAWIDSGALRSEHRSESGLLIEVRRIRDTSLSFSMLTQQPAPAPLADDRATLLAATPALTPWVLLLQTLLPPHSLSPALEALTHALGVEPLHPLETRPASPTPALHALVFEGALRHDIYATGELLGVLATHRATISAAQQQEARALFTAFDAEALWEAEVVSEAVADWRRAEALREIGLPPHTSQETAIAALRAAQAQCAEDALTLDETGLHDLVAAQVQHLTKAAEQLNAAN